MDTRLLTNYDNLLSKQAFWDLKQMDRHSESVGSQEATHLSVSSTQISPQTMFRS